MAQESSTSKGRVGIVGSGLIGKSWAMLFAGAGYRVSLYDSVPDQIPAALTDIGAQLTRLSEQGLLRGDASVQEQTALITGCESLKECAAGAIFVQECVFEDVKLKRSIFEQLDEVVDDITVLSSSSSCIVPSKFTEGLKHSSQCIVSHPINPPYYVPLVEVVPAPWTSPDVVQRTKAIMEEIGQAPIVFKREVLGFAINRLQYAILNESLRLVEDDILSVEDVDKVVSHGLGPRYAFLGAIETAYQNAPKGMIDYATRYGATIRGVSADAGPTPEWTPDSPLMQRIQEEYAAKGKGEENLGEMRALRDECLIKLACLKKDMSKK